MKYYLMFLFILQCIACSVDPPAIPDTYAEFDGGIYMPGNKKESLKYSCNHYFCGSIWETVTNNKTLNIQIYNTCDNNRGLCSNYRGVVAIIITQNNKSEYFRGECPLFEYKITDGKRYFEFKDIFCYTGDSSRFKRVSGRIIHP